jgi:hypothetical protein
MAANDLTRCPKCSNDDGRIEQYKHVAGGTCFLCRGAGQVTERQASRWLAAQLRRDMPRTPVATGRNESAAGYPRKEIRLQGFACTEAADGGIDVRPAPGKVAIVDLAMPEPGVFRGSIGALPFGFVVESGRVRVDMVCNGLRGLERHLERALQAAYKG